MASGSNCKPCNIVTVTALRLLDNLPAMALQATLEVTVHTLAIKHSCVKTYSMLRVTFCVGTVQTSYICCPEGHFLCFQFATQQA